MQTRGAHHLAAQGRLGLDARQLLRDVHRAALGDLPVSYIGAFRAPRAQGLRQRARAAPSRTSPTSTCRATIAQVQGVLDQVIRAVELLFGFALVAGLVVLVRHGVGHARGARARVRGDARGGRRGQPAAPGAARRAGGRRALAGFLASIVASVIGWALARYVFDFTWTASPLVPLGRRAVGRGAGAGRGLVGLARGAAAAGGRDVAAGCGIEVRRRHGRVHRVRYGASAGAAMARKRPRALRATERRSARDGIFPAPLSRAESDALVDRCAGGIAERGWGFWAVEERASGAFIGCVSITVPRPDLPFSPCVEIGWRLARAYWGQGYALEAARGASGRGL